DEGDKDGKKRKWGFLKKMSMTTMNKHPEPRSTRPHRHNDEGRTASDSSSSHARSARGNGSLLGRPRTGNRNSQLIVEETKTLNKRRSFLLLHNNTRAVTPEPATPDASSDSNVVDYKAGLKAIIAYLQDLNDLTPAPGGPVHRNTQASASSPNLSALASGTDAMGSFDSSGRSTPTPNELQKEPVIKCKEDAARREKILEEVLSSERTYLRQLKEMVDIYVKEAEKEVAVSSTGKKEPVVPIAERRTIFGNIDNIIHFHESVFLPNLESAVEILFIKRKAGDTVDTAFIRFMADQVARVFTQHSAFFKLYAPYINNFDLALSRLKAWNAPKSPPPPTSSSSYSMAKSVSSMGAAVSLGMSGITEQNSSMPLSESQKKRLKGYLKKCKADPRHTQVSLESYLLLPVQRIPRYKLLLENLLSCTPVDNKSLMPDPVIKEAADIIAEITADMNERKRESESRHRLLFWQQRIRNRFRSPLVQPHRRMMKEGTVVLMRVLKRRSQYVDVGQQSSAGDVNSHPGTLPSGERSLIQVNSLEVETETRRLIALLCSDILVLCKEPEDGMDGTGPVDLYTVIRLSPTPGVNWFQYESHAIYRIAQANSGLTVIRLVDSRAILYLSCPSHAEALTWVESINLQMQS
ncbi:Dbl homology domain-containing protein, partial [Atractiella rhizophila]